MGRDEILSLRRVGKTYSGVSVLHGVDFDLRAGEVHALVGENGAGKSTLIKITTGMVESDPGGEIRVGGELVAAPSPRHLQAAGIAAVYQNPTLFEELSVIENLRIGEDGPVISWRARARAARAALERVGARVDLSAAVRSLRMAEKQSLEIARALSRRARVLILDEPTAALAEHEAETLLTLVEKLRAEGVGIIYVSHRLEEVIRVADRVTVLRDGRQIGTFAKAELDRPRLIQLMAGRDLAELFPKVVAPVGAVALEISNLAQADSGVAGVSFEVRRGEILGVAGLVGAGRTELARTLFGVTPATSGTIRVAGRPVAIRSVRDAIACGLAYVPEDRKLHGVIEDLPISENISLAVLRRLHGAWLDEERENRLAADFALSLGVRGPSLFAPARLFSGGNQQKVALARWLATEPAVLILDEPTQGIDLGAKAEIHRLMGAWVAKGMAIILISSELPELLSLADRIAVMRGGRLRGVLPARETTRAEVLRLAMEDAA